MNFSFLRTIICIAATTSIILAVGCSTEKTVPKEVRSTEEYKVPTPTIEKRTFHTEILLQKQRKPLQL